MPIPKEFAKLLANAAKGNQKKKKQAVNTAKNSKKKAKVPKEGLKPKRNSPEWYLKLGKLKSTINFLAPSKTGGGIADAFDYGMDRVDMKIRFQNVIPSGGAFDTKAQEMMSDIRNKVFAAQMYETLDLKEYMLLVREALSAWAAIDALCRASMVSDPYDTIASSRYVSSILSEGRNLTQADLEQYNRALPALRQELEQIARQLAPYVPREQAWFQRPLAILGNVFKDTPTKKFNAFIPVYGPSLIHRITKTTGSEVIDYSDVDEDLVQAIAVGDFASIDWGTTFGFQVGDLLMTPVKGADKGDSSFDQNAFEFYDFQENEFNGMKLLRGFMRRITRDFTFGQIRGDLERTYGCYRAEDLIRPNALSISYDPIMLHQLHNATVWTDDCKLDPTTVGAGCFIRPGMVSVDTASGDAYTGPTFYQLNVVSGSYSGKALVPPMAEVANENAKKRRVPDVLVGTWRTPWFDAGMNVVAGQLVNIPQIVDVAQEATDGLVLEAVRNKLVVDTLQFRNGSASANVFSVSGKAYFDANGTDIITDARCIVSLDASGNITTVPARRYDSVAVGNAAAYISRIHMHPLVFVRDNATNKHSVIGELANTGVASGKTLKALIEQGNLSMLTVR